MCSPYGHNSYIIILLNHITHSTCIYNFISNKDSDFFQIGPLMTNEEKLQGECHGLPTGTETGKKRSVVMSGFYNIMFSNEWK